MLSLYTELMKAASLGVKESKELAGSKCHGDAAFRSDIVQLPALLIGLYGAGCAGKTAA